MVWKPRIRVLLLLRDINNIVYIHPGLIPPVCMGVTDTGYIHSDPISIYTGDTGYIHPDPISGLYRR